MEAAAASNAEARLENLPAELIAEICSYLESKWVAGGKQSLLLTCRSLYYKALGALYQEEAREALGLVFEWACKRNEPGTAETLLNYGFDPNLTRMGGLIPLTEAARCGSVPIIELLLERGAAVEDYAHQSSALMAAIMEAPAGCRYDTVRSLLEHGANPNRISPKWISTPLLAAVAKRDLDVIQLLLAFGAEINPIPSSEAATPGPLLRAIFFHQEEDKPVIECLLSAGADPNCVLADASCLTPLKRAIFETCMGVGDGERLRGALSVIDMLLEYGADINLATPGNKECPLHYAVSPVVPKSTIAHLLHQGADINLSAPGLPALYPPIHKAMERKVPPDRTYLLLAHGGIALSFSQAHADATGSGTNPLDYLISLHVECGLVIRRWRPRIEWKKVQALIEHAGPEIASSLGPGRLAVLLSLCVGSSRHETQLRRCLVDFARTMWMGIAEVGEFMGQDEFLEIWREHKGQRNMARKAADVLGEMSKENQRRRYERRSGEDVFVDLELLSLLFGSVTE